MPKARGGSKRKETKKREVKTRRGRPSPFLKMRLLEGEVTGYCNTLGRVLRELPLRRDLNGFARTAMEHEIKALIEAVESGRINRRQHAEIKQVVVPLEFKEQERIVQALEEERHRLSVTSDGASRIARVGLHHPDIEMAGRIHTLVGHVNSGFITAAEQREIRGILGRETLRRLHRAVGGKR